MIQIKNRFSGGIIKEVNLETLREADLRGAYLRGADLRGAYLRGADLRGADLREADLRGANLRGADLEGADLREADLRGTYLRGAYLREADLRVANLEGADLDSLYLTIQGTKHYLSYYNGILQIGCLIHSLEYWLIMYDTIGMEKGYTEAQIKEYHTYMKSIKQMS